VPASFNESTRSVEIVVATEQPVMVYDWQRGEMVNEILRMDGLDPMPRQVPFLDSHNRYSTSDVLGSVRDFRKEDTSLIARTFYAKTSKAEDNLNLARDGHLTDVSAGYRIDPAGVRWVEEDRTEEINGKTYSGPVKVVTRWSLHEVSAVPIGADQAAKVRAAENTKSKEQTMNKELRAYLEKRGLAKDATEEEAWKFKTKLDREEDHGRGHHREPAGDDPPAPAGDDDNGDPPAPPAPAADDGGEGGERQAGQPDIRALAARERERAAEIYAMCRANGIEDEQAAEMVKSGKDAGRCALEVLSMNAERQGGGPGYYGARVQADETDKYRAAAGDAIMVRGGMPVETPAPGHDELRGYTLKELARECLRRSGQRTGGTDHEMVGRALTSSDLPNILANVANKAVMIGWDTASQTWQIWVDDSGSVPDFKESTLVRLSEFDDLDQILEDGEYTYAKLSDIKESFKIGSFGKAIHLGRVMIINDDLAMLTSIPQAMGESSARLVADVAHAAFLSNPNMGDGKPLFDEAHNNIVTITAFDVDGIGEAIQTMTSQKDMKGLRRLNIVPNYFVSPTSFYVTAEKFFGSDVIGTQGEPNIKNPFTGTFKPGSRVYEARLDDDATNVFYLMGPKGKTVKVFFLNGVKAPFIDFTDDWNTDGRKGKVRIDVGAKALDWRGMLKVTVNAGG
jgi:hypothetical protein